MSGWQTISDRRVEVPEGVHLDGAEICEEVRPPDEKERRRGEMRADIQRAITSVEFYGGGIIGQWYRPQAAGHVGPQCQRARWLAGWRRAADGKRWVARTPIGDNPKPHSVAIAWRDLEEQIDRAVGA